jgi:hypothetical protein
MSSPGAKLDSRSSYTPYPPRDSGTTNKSSEEANVSLEVMIPCSVVLSVSICAEDDGIVEMNTTDTNKVVIHSIR